jgi:hypothetical protein
MHSALRKLISVVVLPLLNCKLLLQLMLQCVSKVNLVRNGWQKDY